MIVSSSGQRFRGCYQFTGQPQAINSTYEKLKGQNYKVEMERLFQLISLKDNNKDKTLSHKPTMVIFHYYGQLLGLSGKDALELRKYIEDYDQDDQLLRCSIGATPANPRYARENKSPTDLVDDFFSDYELEPEKFKNIDITV